MKIVLNCVLFILKAIPWYIARIFLRKEGIPIQHSSSNICRPIRYMEIAKKKK